MTLVQSWLIVGVPGLVVALGLFVGRSALRAALGYVVLALLVVFFLTVPGDAVSAAVVGLSAFVLVATGRGTHLDDSPEHHENRSRFTRDPSQA